MDQHSLSCQLHSDTIDQVLEASEQMPLELSQYRAPQLQQSHREIVAKDSEAADTLMLQYELLPDSLYVMCRYD